MITFFITEMWPVIFIVLLGLVFVGMAGYGLFNPTAPFAESWKLLTLAALGSFLFFWSLIVYFLYRDKISVGVNDSGLFVKSYGFVFWDQIKTIEFGWLGIEKSRECCIYVSLHNPENFFSKNVLSRGA